jgi:hypothetical protein
MLEFIEAQKSAEGHDLLSLLLEANAGEGDKSLSVSELIGIISHSCIFPGKVS